MTTLAASRTNERVTPIVTLFLVFLCGAVSGAMVMSFAGHNMLHAAPPRAGAPPGLHLSVGEWKQALDLSDSQTQQLTSILDDFSVMYDNVLADGKSRIIQILNPEQKKKFDRLIQEHKPH